MTSMDLEIIDLTEVVGDWEIPCEYAGDEVTACKDDPARWVLHLKPCCPAGAGVRLACEPCKEARVAGGGAVYCEHCGHTFFPAREAYHYIEPLERK